jgi:hypothetical protein
MAVNPTLDSVKEQVDVQIQGGQTRADSSTQSANNFLAGLMNAAFLGAPSIGDLAPGNVAMSINALPTVAPDRPTAAIDSIKDRIGLPPTSDYSTTTFTTNFPTIDEKTITPPTISLPDAPTFVTEVSADIPVIAEVFNAVAPTEAVPAALTGIGNYTIPAPPSVSVVEFGEPLPSYEYTIPSLTFSYIEVEYTSALKDALTAKLLSDVQNGGTGLDPEIEEAIWERTRERDELDYQDAADKIDSRWAGKGFSLPNGVLTELHQDLIVDYRNKREEVNRDIMIKQAELAQTNTHFAITSSMNLEQLEINHANEIANRALKAEEAAVNFGIAYHNLKVTDYNIQLEKAKIQTLIQNSELDAQKLILEEYRTSLLESEAKGKLDRDLLAKYNMDLERYQKFLNLFQSEQGAVQTALGIEGLKIDFYNSNIKEFSSRLDAQSKQAELYIAQTEGELGKVKVYEAELSAERTRIDTLKLQVDTELAKLKQSIDLQELELRAFLGNIEKYKATSQIAQIELSQEAIMYGHDIDRYRGEMSRDTAQLGMSIETMIKQRALDIQNAGVRLENAKANLQAVISTAGLRVEASKGIASAYVSLAGAAMSGLTTVASIESGGLSSETADVGE